MPRVQELPVEGSREIIEHELARQDTQEPRRRTDAGIGRRGRAIASESDVRRQFGDIDSAKAVAILRLRPNIGEIEEAAMWCQGNAYLLGRRPLTSNARQIIEIVWSDEEWGDEP